MHDHLLTDISLCVVVAWILAVIARWARQPLIVAYLLGGVLLGPVGLGWIADRNAIQTISELGLIFLLFMIGLEIDLNKVLTAGKAILVTSAVQVVGGTLLGLLLFRLLGFALGQGRLDALYLAFAAALSSTVIIVKLLHDKHELDTLAGRITLGVLVIQDLFAILFLAIQPNLNNPGVTALLLSLGKVILLVVAALIVSKYVLPALFRSVARLPELVLVGALAWCFAVCGFALSLGLSPEMGALIAGVALSTFPYALDVTAKVTSLRDFFLTIFFVALGMTIPLPSWSLVGMAIVFSVLLVLSRFATVFISLHRMNLGHRVSFLPALNLSQVSEFSLVIVALGKSAQHVSDQMAGIVAYAFAFLAVASSYGMTCSEAILRGVSPCLRRLGLRDFTHPSPAVPDALHLRKPIYFLGFYSTASSLLAELAQRAPELLKEIAVIDFNPMVNTELRRRGIPVIYGDISQRETLLHAGVAEAELLVCTIPNSLLKGTTNLRLVRQLREINSKAQIMSLAEVLSDVPKLYSAGASFVSVPRLTEAKILCEAIRASRENRLHFHDAESLEDLNERQEVIG